LLSCTAHQPPFQPPPDQLMLLCSCARNNFGYHSSTTLTTAHHMSTFHERSPHERTPHERTPRWCAPHNRTPCKRTPSERTPREWTHLQRAHQALRRGPAACGQQCRLVAGPGRRAVRQGRLVMPRRGRRLQLPAPPLLVLRMAEVCAWRNWAALQWKGKPGSLAPSGCVGKCRVGGWLASAGVVWPPRVGGGLGCFPCPDAARL